MEEKNQQKYTELQFVRHVGNASKRNIFKLEEILNLMDHGRFIVANEKITGLKDSIVSLWTDISQREKQLLSERQNENNQNSKS